MPKSLVLGNGHMLVAFDKFLQVRDLYYPYVGLEDHTTVRNFHRVGFFTEGKFSWLSDPGWEISIDYLEDTLVGKGIATNTQLGISVLFEDFVYTSFTVFFRKLTITNLTDRQRDISVFFSHNFFIYGEKLQDTAEYEPKLNAVLHYRRNRYFLVNGLWDNGAGMDQFTVGKNGLHNLEGTFKDAEDDGELQGNTIDQGSVDSTVRFKQNFLPNTTRVLNFWLCLERNYHKIHELNTRVKEFSPQTIFVHTHDYWKKWVQKEHFAFGDLPADIVRLFKRSLLTIRTQIDDGGAIIAANDTDILEFNRDTYSYMWPRDGAYVAISLSEAGYEALPRNFFEFCKRVITHEGFLLNKYLPDGSVGSSWHPKVSKDGLQLPIQEDETAITLVALQKYYEQFRTIEVIQSHFNDLILKAGNWLAGYIDPETNLPLPSYDLWEERRGVHTYTCATVYAGLIAAANLSEETGHHRSAELFRTKAEHIKEAILTNLYSPQDNRFLKSITIQDGVIRKDNTVDASLSQLWKLGLVAIDDPRMQSTMEAIRKSLSVPTKIGGICRYTKDNYHFDHNHLSHETIPGNPWIITTLWEADYTIATATKPEDLEKPLETLHWVCRQASQSGLLAEQMHPTLGIPLAVAPLTWSHSTFVSTVLSYVKKKQELAKSSSLFVSS